MAISKSSTLILTSASIAANGTKTSPSAGGTGSWINTSTFYGGDLGYSITNGTSAPGTAGVITFQTSPDGGTTVFDYYTVSGDVSVSSVNTGTLWLDQGVMFVRAIAYGNITNPVTVAANLQAITAV